MSKRKKILLSLIGGLLAFLLIVYGYVEACMQLSYRSKAYGDYSAAQKYASQAFFTAQFIYPHSSERVQKLALYYVRLIAETENRINGANEAAAKLMTSYVKATDGLSNKSKALLLLESARLSNATGFKTTGGILTNMANDVIKSEKDPSYNELKNMVLAEKAFSDFLDFQLQPQRTKAWEELITKDQDKAHKFLCESNQMECQFNTTRWEIGKCIRFAILNEYKQCKNYRKLAYSAFNALKVCEKLSQKECHQLQKQLEPYYLQLLIYSGEP